MDKFSSVTDEVGITKVISIPTESHMNLCTKFHGNPSNSCQDISLQTTNFKLMVVLEEKSEDH